MMDSLVNLFYRYWSVYREFVDFSKSSFILSFLLILASPTFWNVMSQIEYKNRTFQRIFHGNKYLACYLFATMIFVLSSIRNIAYNFALDDQPKLHLPLDDFYLQIFSYIILGFGSLLVLSSFLRLGITGTFNGDYFGIYMDEPVKGFPFNFFANPMYTGSTLNFLSVAILKKSVAGIILTAWVYIVYYVYSLTLENPFTKFIYSSGNAEKSLAGSKLEYEKLKYSKNTKSK